MSMSDSFMLVLLLQLLSFGDVHIDISNRYSHIEARTSADTNGTIKWLLKVNGCMMKNEIALGATFGGYLCKKWFFYLLQVLGSTQYIYIHIYIYISKYCFVCFPGDSLFDPVLKTRVLLLKSTVSIDAGLLTLEAAESSEICCGSFQ